LESNRIIELIKYPSSATTEEQEEILSLSRQYAYSAILKIILAKIASVNQSSLTNQFITSAAIATADRANLKNYIQTGEWEISTAVQEQKIKPEAFEEIRQDEPVTKPQPSEEVDTSRKIITPNTEPEEPAKSGRNTQGMESGTKEVSSGQEETPESSGDINADAEITWQEEKDDHKENEYVLPSGEDASGEKENVKPPANQEASSGEKKDSEVNLTTQDHQKSADSNALPIDQEPTKQDKKEDQIPNLSEKNFEAIPVEQLNVNDPLASDLLKNIQEYRKSRDFFEKLLKEDDQDVSGKTSGHTGEKDGKKDKKKSGKTDGKKPRDPEVKKKSEKPEQEIKSLDQDSARAGKPAREKDPGKTGKEKSAKEKTGTEETESSFQEKIPTEIPDKDVLEKETEERKSEGYQVYEEEDPEVIRQFIEKVAETSGEPEIVKKLKKEEQVEIIENFIKTDPRIKNFKSPKGLKEREDLSLPSVKFNDDIISENLANIMKSQGKTEQAIDIYKKLIWKFPQKKTYFASQIEELKKKSGN
jgi:tetratricopeptide (TPR) repeat protein